MTYDPETGEDYDDPDYVEFCQKEFTAGGCLEFAAVLHQRFGWQMRASIAVGDGVLGHAWVVRPDGRAVDAWGVREGRDAPTWPPSNPEITDDFSLAELEDRFGLEPDMMAWARDLLAARPEIIDADFVYTGSRYAPVSSVVP